MNFSESTNRELGLSKKIISTELSGVFNWVLEGVREYLRIGLAEPAETTAAIADYRAEVDPVQTFLTEAVDEGRIILDPDSKIKPGDLRRAYLNWCENNGVRYPVGERKFSQRLEELGFESTRGNGGVRLRLGIKVNDAFGSGWLVG
jgi:putative DNA primase/helicase